MEAAVQIPEAWQSVSDDRQAIPGCTKKYQVAGVNVYVINGEKYLSTGSVLKLSPWGRIDHVPPAALAYGSARGSWVDECCRMADDGTLDWDGTNWEQTFDGKRMNLRPFVEAWELWKADHAWRTEACEELVLNPEWRTFGYLDRRGVAQKANGIVVGRTVIDIKTSAVITDREKLQIASYLRLGEGGAAVQLRKDGRYETHALDIPNNWQARFATLAYEAHAWLAQQEAR